MRKSRPGCLRWQRPSEPPRAAVLHLAIASPSNSPQINLALFYATASKDSNQASAALTRATPTFRRPRQPLTVVMVIVRGWAVDCRRNPSSDGSGMAQIDMKSEKSRTAALGSPGA